MPGEKNLEQLISRLSPKLNEGVYVFCSLPPGMEISTPGAVGMFTEKEGKTLIMPIEEAEQLHLEHAAPMAWITLEIHSALDAVGLTAAVSNALASKGISCNMVAAYFHDHIFVPVEDAERAMLILQNLSQTATDK